MLIRNVVLVVVNVGVLLAFWVVRTVEATYDWVTYPLVVFQVIYLAIVIDKIWDKVSHLYYEHRRRAHKTD